MHTVSATARLLLLLCGLASAAVWAQAPATLPRTDTAPASKTPDQTIERIRHEDAGSRIDELRVGGETKSITVQPKGDAPAYQVVPESNNRNPAATERSGEGKPGWQIFQY